MRWPGSSHASSFLKDRTPVTALRAQSCVAPARNRRWPWARPDRDDCRGHRISHRFYAYQLDVGEKPERRRVALGLRHLSTSADSPRPALEWTCDGRSPGSRARGCSPSQVPAMPSPQWRQVSNPSPLTVAGAASDLRTRREGPRAPNSLLTHRGNRLEQYSNRSPACQATTTVLRSDRDPL